MSKAARANRVGRTSCRWGFIGAGKMASALVHGMLRAGICAGELHLRERPSASGPQPHLATKPESPCSNPMATS